MTDRERESLRIRQARRRANGVCHECGRELDGKYKRCKHCRELNAMNQKRYRMRGHTVEP